MAPYRWVLTLALAGVVAPHVAVVSSAKQERSFSTIDANSDGVVTVAELQQDAAEAGLGDVTHVFLTADSNRDGFLSFQEFARLAASSPPPTHTVAAASPRSSGVRVTREEVQGGQKQQQEESTTNSGTLVDAQVYDAYHGDVMAVQSANAKLLATFGPRRRAAAVDAIIVDDDVFLAPRMPGLASLHHFACSGGTLIARCLHAMQGAFVVSEVDPLSTMQAPQSALPRFAPTDLVRQMRNGRPGLGQIFTDHDAIDVFLAGLETLALRTSNLTGSPRGHANIQNKLVVRDHPHSHFCVAGSIPVRPTLAAILSLRFQLSSAVTIRHPMASYLSLLANNWDQTNGLDECVLRASQYVSFASLVGVVSCRSHAMVCGQLLSSVLGLSACICRGAIVQV